MGPPKRLQEGSFSSVSTSLLSWKVSGSSPCSTWMDEWTPVLSTDQATRGYGRWARERGGIRSRVPPSICWGPRRGRHELVELPAPGGRHLPEGEGCVL